ncbi:MULTISPECIES: hypothetical protein [unclassified Streptomyces]|uniref:hypothetical protein n=1 Tax=unclassified Streptomyces TaxID=2593676 RepID=UPI0037FB0CD4
MTWNNFKDILPLITLLIGAALGSANEVWREKRHNKRELERRIEERREVISDKRAEFEIEVIRQLMESIERCSRRAWVITCEIDAEALASPDRIAPRRDPLDSELLQDVLSVNRLAVQLGSTELRDEIKQLREALRVVPFKRTLAENREHWQECSRMTTKAIDDLGNRLTLLLSRS